MDGTTEGSSLCVDGVLLDTNTVGDADGDGESSIVRQLPQNPK